MLDPTRMDDVTRRGADVATVVGAWRSCDERRRKLQGELDTLRQQKNSANDRMSKLAKLDPKGAEFAAAREEGKALSTKIKEGEVQFAAIETEWEALLLAIPNAPSA